MQIIFKLNINVGISTVNTKILCRFRINVSNYQTVEKYYEYHGEKKLLEILDP